MRLRRGRGRADAGRCSPQAKSGSKGTIDRVSGNFSSVKLGEKRMARRRESSLRRFRTRYQRLQVQMEQQRQALWQRFQQSSLQVLESWLLQWPAHKAQENPQLPAVNYRYCDRWNNCCNSGAGRSHRWEQNFLMTHSCTNS